MTYIHKSQMKNERIHLKNTELYKSMVMQVDLYYHTYNIPTYVHLANIKLFKVFLTKS